MGQMIAPKNGICCVATGAASVFRLGSEGTASCGTAETKTARSLVGSEGSALDRAERLDAPSDGMLRRGALSCVGTWIGSGRAAAIDFAPRSMAAGAGACSVRSSPAPSAVATETAITDRRQALFLSLTFTTSMK